MNLETYMIHLQHHTLHNGIVVLSEVPIAKKYGIVELKVKAITLEIRMGATSVLVLETQSSVLQDKTQTAVEDQLCLTHRLWDGNRHLLQSPFTKVRQTTDRQDLASNHRIADQMDPSSRMTRECGTRSIHSTNRSIWVIHRIRVEPVLGTLVVPKDQQHTVTKNQKNQQDLETIHILQIIFSLSMIIHLSLTISISHLLKQQKLSTRA